MQPRSWPEPDPVIAAAIRSMYRGNRQPPLPELLMACGVCQAVDKHLCSFQRWLPGHLAGITNPEHVKTVRLFATWRVLPDLRTRAEQSHITPSVRREAAEKITHATVFLHWLDTRGRTLVSCRPGDIDAGFGTQPWATLWAEGHGAVPRWKP
jgi:hypothetical protein